MKSLTIIVTASVIPSHPSTELIEETLTSLTYLGFKDAPIILAHDHSTDPRYEAYMRKVAAISSRRVNMQIVQRRDRGGLAGNVREAMQYVLTPFVMIVQHDLPFVRPINIKNVIQDMQKNAQLKHVRFNKRRNIKLGFDAKNDLFGKELTCQHYTYTRTPAWSDNNHICRTAYYVEQVLPRTADLRPIESSMHQLVNDEAAHDIFGTYLLGPNNELPYIKHTDGRNYKRS